MLNAAVGTPASQLKKPRPQVTQSVTHPRSHNRLLSWTSKTILAGPKAMWLLFLRMSICRLWAWLGHSMGSKEGSACSPGPPTRVGSGRMHCQEKNRNYVHRMGSYRQAWYVQRAAGKKGEGGQIFKRPTNWQHFFIIIFYLPK